MHPDGLPSAERAQVDRLNTASLAELAARFVACVTSPTSPKSVLRLLTMLLPAVFLLSPDKLTKPFKRDGSIGEQVAPILFLRSDEAGYIPGTALPVAGGDTGRSVVSPAN